MHVYLKTMIFAQMVFPWMFDEIHALKHLKKAANLLAEKKNWPQLYNVTALNKNQVYLLFPIPVLL